MRQALITAEAGAIVGRGSESALVRRWVGAEPRHGALVLTGGAGIGKTTLWQAGLGMAAERGMHVLVARPSEGESHLSFAALGDLLDGVGADITARLPAPQKRALDAALLRAEPANALEPRTIAAACLSVIRELARSRPVVIAIDDVQWLDAPSLDALVFAARRLQRQNVSFLLTLRAGQSSALVHAFPQNLVDEIEVGGLSLGATRELLIERLGLTLPRWAMTRLFEATGGNPLFALEVGHRLAVDGVPQAHEPFPVPEDVRTAVAERVSVLPAGTRDLLLAASLLARADMQTVQQVIGADVDAALEPAERAEVATLKRGLVTFSHPLYAAAVVGSATTAERRGMHERLAAAVTDPEERAWYLSLATQGTNPEVAQLLEHGAAQARARGGLHAAADLLERARDLTHPDDAATARARGLAAAELHIHSGNPDRAHGLLEHLLGEELPSPQRAEALRLLAELSLSEEDLLQAERLLEEALPLTPEPERAARIQLELVFLRSLRFDFHAAAATGHEALQRLEGSSDSALLAEALAYTAMADFLAGNGLDWPTVELALSLEEPGRIALPGLSAGAVCGVLMSYDGRHTEARAQLERKRTELVERGDEGDLAHLLLWLSWLELRCARLVEAEQTADDAIASAEITGNSSMRGFAAVQRAYTLAHRGELDEARRICIAEAERLGDRSVAQIGLWIATTLTFIELSLANHEAAWRHCEGIVASLDQMGPYEPITLMFLPDALESLIALDRLSEAESLLDVFEQRGRDLDRVWALATAARCRGLLLAARGDLVGALAALEQALAEHARIEMPFERARTLLVRGIVERRARQRARAKASLEEASTEFERLGAQVWAERAREELGRLGGRRATADGELTPAERRVADLAAAGHSNKEIGALLFVSIHTVEVHLSRVYAKLGVRSRAQLAGGLEKQRVEATTNKG